MVDLFLIVVSILQSFSENRAVHIGYIMLVHYTILGFLACTAGLILGFSEVSSEMVYPCAPKKQSVCFVNDIKQENANMDFNLANIGDKKMLNFKTGRIEALRPKQCQMLSKFTMITIGRVGLKELCFATTFVEVNAQHNSLRQLHVDQDAGTYHLEVLQLDDNQLESVEGICAFDNLKKLHLERNFLSTLNMACFEQMTKLEELHLAYNRLNTISTPIPKLYLPKLDFIGLQNNTLIELDLQKWSLPALEKLELSANNLTHVRGLKNLEALSNISLAGNRWQCNELDQMLEALVSNGVTIKDGDQDCSPIRNSTICCTYEQLVSEETLLDVYEKFTNLEQRYARAENEFNNRIKQEIELFERKIKELQETLAKPNTPVEASNPVDPGKDPENPDDGVNIERPEQDKTKCECECSKESMDKLEPRLDTLEKNIVQNNVTLQSLLENKSHFSYMTILTKHEFRTAVKRGKDKLKELTSMLGMLRDHINQKQNQH